MKEGLKPKFQRKRQLCSDHNVSLLRTNVKASVRSHFLQGSSVQLQLSKTGKVRRNSQNPAATLITDEKKTFPIPLASNVTQLI